MTALTPREQQVCQGLLAGRAYRQIGQELGLRRHSIHGIAKRVYRVLGVEGRIGRAGLFSLARQRGWVPRRDRGLVWTRREQHLLDGLLRGERQREIAQSLGISPATLVLALARMRAYVGVRTTAALLRVAVEQGAESVPR